MAEPTYSFVVPVYNEEETLPALEQRLSELLATLDGPAEVLFVDDGSTDGSWRLISEVVGRDPRFKAIGFSRNFGHQVAITAGLDHANGEAVVVMDAFRSMRENNRYVRGMFAWIGFRQIGVSYRRAERYAGQTKYPLRKMLKFATDGIIGFSNVPLRVALQAGFIVSGGAFAFGVAALIAKLAGFYHVSGLASLAIVTAFLGGMQLIVLGVMGEYIARIHDEVKDRPLYIVRESLGL